LFTLSDGQTFSMTDVLVVIVNGTYGALGGVRTENPPGTLIKEIFVGAQASYTTQTGTSGAFGYSFQTPIVFQGPATVKFRALCGSVSGTISP